MHLEGLCVWRASQLQHHRIPFVLGIQLRSLPIYPLLSPPVVILGICYTMKTPVRNTPVVEPQFLRDIESAADRIAESFWTVNKTIHDNPELGYKEVIAHDALTSFMELQAGWKVQRSAYGISTAWVAVYDTGVAGPVVSYNAEFGELMSSSLISLFSGAHLL